MNTTILKSIANRTSAFAFDPKPIPAEVISLLFDAARWAPSSYNEQPWRFYYASRSNTEAFEALIKTLVAPNAQWAKNASLIIISAAKKLSDVSGKENYYALHDTALAEANLIIQAQELGLITHVMGGFSHGKARTSASIPDDYHIAAAIAVGYPTSTETLSPELKQRANAPRVRNEIKDFAFEV
jgi:nitroreductase